MEYVYVHVCGEYECVCLCVVCVCVCNYVFLSISPSFGEDRGLSERANVGRQGSAASLKRVK